MAFQRWSGTLKIIEVDEATLKINELEYARVLILNCH